MDITDELKAHMRDNYRGPSESLLMDMFLLVHTIGCSCMTKTPEVMYHDETCDYRLAHEAQDKLVQIKQNWKIKYGN